MSESCLVVFDDSPTYSDGLPVERFTPLLLYEDEFSADYGVSIATFTFEMNIQEMSRTAEHRKLITKICTTTNSSFQTTTFDIFSTDPLS